MQAVPKSLPLTADKPAVQWRVCQYSVPPAQPVVFNIQKQTAYTV